DPFKRVADRVQDLPLVERHRPEIVAKQRKVLGRKRRKQPVVYARRDQASSPPYQAAAQRKSHAQRADPTPSSVGNLYGSERFGEKMERRANGRSPVPVEVPFVRDSA